jgi:hypothetical protein
MAISKINFKIQIQKKIKHKINYLKSTDKTLFLQKNNERNPKTFS